MKMIVWSVICCDVMTLNVATHKRHVDMLTLSAQSTYLLPIRRRTSPALTAQSSLHTDLLTVAGVHGRCHQRVCVWGGYNVPRMRQRRKHTKIGMASIPFPLSFFPFPFPTPTSFSLLSSLYPPSPLPFLHPFLFLTSRTH